MAAAPGAGAEADRAAQSRASARPAATAPAAASIERAVTFVAVLTAVLSAAVLAGGMLLFWSATPLTAGREWLLPCAVTALVLCTAMMCAFFAARRAARPLRPRWQTSAWRDVMFTANGVLVAAGCCIGLAQVALQFWLVHFEASPWRTLGLPLVIGACCLLALTMCAGAWLLPRWSARAVLRAWLPVRLRNEFLALGAWLNPMLALQLGFLTLHVFEGSSPSRDAMLIFLADQFARTCAALALAWAGYVAVRWGLVEMQTRAQRSAADSTASSTATATSGTSGTTAAALPAAVPPLLWVVVDTERAAEVLSLRDRVLEPLLGRTRAPSSVLLAPADSGVGTVLCGEHLALALRLGWLERLRPALATQLQDWRRTLPPQEPAKLLPLRELYPAPGLMVEAVRTLMGPQDRVLLIIGNGAHPADEVWRGGLDGARVRVLRLMDAGRRGADGLPAINEAPSGYAGYRALRSWSEIYEEWLALPAVAQLVPEVVAQATPQTLQEQAAEPVAAHATAPKAVSAPVAEPVAEPVAAASPVTDAAIQLHITLSASGNALQFSQTTTRARAEQLQVISWPLLHPLLTELAGLDTKPEVALMRSVVNLLVPREVQDLIESDAGANPSFELLLDEATDRLPWELLLAVIRHNGSSEAPQPVRVVRRLRDPFTSVNRARVQSERTPAALLIADPASDPALALAPLPGARQEATRQSESLRAAGFEARLLLQASGEDVIKALLGHDWHVLVLAGHGIDDEHDGAGTGMPLGKDSRLTVRELAVMRRPPELVFASVEMLAEMPSSNRKQPLSPRGGNAPSWASGLTDMDVRAFVLAAGKLDDESAAQFGAMFFERLCQSSRATAGDAMLAACQALHWAGKPAQQWSAYRLYGDANYRLPAIAPAGSAA